MKNFFRGTHDIFCAFCRHPRRVYKSRRIGFSHIFWSSLGSVALMFVIWNDFDPRVLMIFVSFLAIAEVFVQVRWRMAITCQQCGFDPVIYRRDPEVAAEKVKTHLQRRKEDPRYILSPPLKIPTRRVPAESAFSLGPTKVSSTAKTQGTLISRQV